VSDVIRSMTAFAREERRDEHGELVWEVRSVNHRYLEVFVRLPDEFRVLETTVRERVATRLGRGKVECMLRYRPAPAALAAVQVNRALAERVIAAARSLADLLPDSRDPSAFDVLRWPGVLETEVTDLSPAQAAATELLDRTLESLGEARGREGGRLGELIAQRCAGLHVLVGRARERMPVVLDGVRGRLRARLAEVADQLDPMRIEQEMALLAQRLDVDEEMDRLTTHLGEVERALRRPEPAGRRLDFLMQELNREANTLSSKSADAELTSIGVEMKVLIEQMREQIQNIE
jgi:uncharacterized protein (TIGR00255 family)